jgi:hypothetical protein
MTGATYMIRGTCMLRGTYMVRDTCMLQATCMIRGTCMSIWHSRSKSNFRFYALYYWSNNLKRRVYLDDLDIDGKIIFRWILQKNCVMVWTGFNWHRIGLIYGAVVNTVLSLWVS